MIYLSQMLGIPVLDANGERIGRVNDLGIATREVFPRVTSLAFEGPGKTPFMLSWRKYVERFDNDALHLNCPSTDIRFSYLQPDEVLIARDLLNKQIVDTRGLKVVRVNDLKLSNSGADQLQLRLIGAEVGVRGLLRSIHPVLERAWVRVSKTFGKEVPEEVIAWNYMDLLDRDLSDVKLSVSHKTLDDMHPADVADILEQLDPRLRGNVFAQLDDAHAAEAVAELDDDEMAVEIMGELDADVASRVLAEMDPDDAAELVAELGQDKAERLLRLMGVKEEHAIRQLLGYREDTAGRIMTSEFVALPKTATVADARKKIAGLEEGFESLHYVYTLDDFGKLAGVVSLRSLLVAVNDRVLGDLANAELVTAGPDDDQEVVAENIAKYNLLAMPVVDDDGRILGIVTVDDALDVLEEEHAEDLHIASGSTSVGPDTETDRMLFRLFDNEMWFFFWVAGCAALLLVSRSITGSTHDGAVAALALPLALHLADDMVRYVIAAYLEFNEGDEDAPSLLGLALRGMGAALVFCAVAVLVVMGCVGVLFGDGAVSASFAKSLTSGSLPTALVRSFEVAGATSLLSFVSAPAYLATVRRRDARDKDTSGKAMRGTALGVASVLFLVLFALVIGLGV